MDQAVQFFPLTVKSTPTGKHDAETKALNIIRNKTIGACGSVIPYERIIIGLSSETINTIGNDPIKFINIDFLRVLSTSPPQPSLRLSDKAGSIILPKAFGRNNAMLFHCIPIAKTAKSEAPFVDWNKPI